VVGVCYADQCRADDLDECRNDIACDEDLKNSFRGGQGRVFSADSIGHDADDGVNGSRKEDWSNSDEEIPDHKEGEPSKSLAETTGSGQHSQPPSSRFRR
jgi:hypothetical protein